MICKVCQTENPQNSQFCLECGAAFVKKERVSKGYMKVPPMTDKIQKDIKEQMEKWRKDEWYIPSIPVEDQLRKIIPGVQNVNNMYGEPYTEVTPLGPEEIKQRMEDMNKCFCGTAVQKFVYNHRSEEPHMCANCGWKNKNHPTYIDDMRKENSGMLETLTSALAMHEETKKNIEKINKINDTPHILTYEVEDRLKQVFDCDVNITIIDQCGVCGTDNCKDPHIPSIQQQYQEAFENIQRFRRLRVEQWEKNQKIKEIQISVVKGLIPPEMRLFGSHLLPNPNFPDGSSISRKSSITRRDVHKGIGRPKKPKEKPPQSAITGTDVRKGIEPKKSIAKVDENSMEIPEEPFESIRIRKT